MTLLIEMKEAPNASSICKYIGAKLEAKELGKMIKVMSQSVPKEELHKYKITIDFNGW